MSQELAYEETEVGRAILEYLESGVAVVGMGLASERVITLTPKRLLSIREIVERLKSERPKGLIFMSPSAEMFTAGADIGLIRDVKDARVGEEFAREGQAIFDLIEALPFTTVAAISGPCVGGGCEMALACRYRIITEHRSSVIGLPEIKLGILPGFGGTQRLPRLIGLPKALDIILGGKTLKPRQARAYGLVDEVVPGFEELFRRAEAIALGKKLPRRVKPSFSERLLTKTRIGRGIVAKKARQSIAKETKGFYPAPLRALESVITGLERGKRAGYEREAKELGELVVTPESKALVNMFFLTEASKSLGKPAKKQLDDLRAVVVGAGAMGAGIAGVLARAECQVILKDTTEQALGRGVNQIKEYASKIRSLSESERSFLINRIEATTKDSPQVSHARLAIEAVFENMTIKKSIFTDLAQKMPGDAILATNTSSLSVTEVSDGIPSPERVIGIHFFNPVDRMPLVEIIRGKTTSDKTMLFAAALAVKLGKYPIVVEDVPGFLVNRILSPYLVEAAYLLQEGYSILDIDRAATAFGMPMGPLRLLDEVGLDVAAHVSETMVTGYGDRMRGPLFAKLLAEQGRLGKKSGQGFYIFHGKDFEPAPDIRQILKLEITPKVGDAAYISDRLIMSLINEAVRCFDEGVAGVPSPEAANQIDLGTVMGFGFPPFRGGVLYYADQLGAKRVLESLTRMQEKIGSRLVPAPGIARRAAQGKGFHQALTSS